MQEDLGGRDLGAPRTQAFGGANRRSRIGLEGFPGEPTDEPAIGDDRTRGGIEPQLPVGAAEQECLSSGVLEILDTLG